MNCSFYQQEEAYWFIQGTIKIVIITKELVLFRNHAADACGGCRTCYYLKFPRLLPRIHHKALTQPDPPCPPGGAE